MLVSPDSQADTDPEHVPRAKSAAPRAAAGVRVRRWSDSEWTGFSNPKPSIATSRAGPARRLARPPFCCVCRGRRLLGRGPTTAVWPPPVCRLRRRVWQRSRLRARPRIAAASSVARRPAGSDRRSPGPLTTGAVTIQRAHGVAADGMVGPQTKARLLAQSRARASASGGARSSEVAGAGSPHRERLRPAACPRRRSGGWRRAGVLVRDSAGARRAVGGTAVALLFGTGWVLGNAAGTGVRDAPTGGAGRDQAQPRNGVRGAARMSPGSGRRSVVRHPGGERIGLGQRLRGRARPDRARRGQGDRAAAHVVHPAPAREDRAIPDNDEQRAGTSRRPPTERPPAATPSPPPAPRPAPRGTPKTSHRASRPPPCGRGMGPGRSPA